MARRVGGGGKDGQRILYAQSVDGKNWSKTDGQNVLFPSMLLRLKLLHYFRVSNLTTTCCQQLFWVSMAYCGLAAALLLARLSPASNGWARDRDSKSHKIFAARLRRAQRGDALNGQRARVR